MLKVAIIGAGHIGSSHARHYTDHPDVELVAICDQSAERADKLARQWGVKAYYDLGEMLRAETLDAVSVATSGVESGSHHFAPTMQCFEAGLHVLCEKPISNDIEEARTMVRTARERGLLFGINLNHRFSGPADRLKEWQNEGRLGETLFVNMWLTIGNPSEATPWHHLRALHPHSIDVMRFYGGDIARVQCFATKAPERTIWSTISMSVQFTSGAVGRLTGSWDSSWHHPIERCEVGGSNGRAILENVYQKLELLPRDNAEKTVIEQGIMGGMASFDDTFKLRIAKFIEQVQAGEPLVASGADGLAAQEVIEAAIRSIENGTVEEVPAAA